MDLISKREIAHTNGEMFQFSAENGTVIKDLVNKYKQYINKEGLGDELYKFQLIKKFKNHWDLEAADFADMIKKTDFGNLVYPNTKGVLNDLALQRPAETKALFQNLFDEQQPLQDRIDNFRSMAEDLYNQIKTDPKHAAYQEERAIATYLAFRFPEKYFLYKDSFYSTLCEVLKIKKAPAGKKYVHYLELVNNVRDHFVANDTELTQVLTTHLDENSYDDPRQTVLTQDILYTTLDKVPNRSNNNELLILERLRQIGNRQAAEIYFDHLNILFTSCQIEEGDDLLFLTAVKNKRTIAFTYGNRYIHTLVKEKSRFEFAFILSSEDALKYNGLPNTKQGVFSGRFPMAWLSIFLTLDELSSFDFSTLLSDCTKALNLEIERDFGADLKKKFEGRHNDVIYKLAMNKSYRESLFATAFPDAPNQPVIPQISIGSPSKMAKNTILYGPPGTGKTYSTIDIAVEIAGQASLNHTDNKKQFDTLREEGFIEFITFHQNYSYEDFVVGLRPVESAGSLMFKKHEGIFYELCKRAEANYRNSLQGQAVGSFEAGFEAFIKPLTDGKELPVKLLGGDGSFFIYDLNETTLFFRKQNGNTDHSLSISTLKDIYSGTRDIVSGLKYYYKAIVRDIKAAQPKTAREPLRNYVLIIDEINRANISKVFGELITLLEDDKRIGGANELKLTLPNGERGFGIPPNLYIVGTMNTADKSIAHIDIALRRRFDFVGKYPETNELTETFAKVLERLNKSILSYKKTPDFLIGHAYFMNRPESELNNIIKYKVLPLLNEYFIGRTDIIKDILRTAEISFVEDNETYQIELV